MKVWRLACSEQAFPLRARLCLDRFRREREIGSDADQGIGLAARDQCFEHGAIG